MAWPLLYVADVNVVEPTWQSRVHGIVEQLAEGLAAGQDEKIRRRIRALADDLMRDMLGAVCGASASEIAEAISAFEGTRAERAALQRAAARASAVGRAKADSARAIHATHPTRARHGEPGRRERDAESRGVYSPPSSHAHDPFDITMPSELLASTEETKRDRSDGTATRGAASQASGGEPRVLPRLLSTPASSPAAGDDAEAESERRPKVVLREGERLLKGTGSGVVIRRERRVKP